MSVLPEGEYLLAVQSRAVAALVDEWRGGSILEVGGGHGQLLGLLLDHGFTVTVLGSEPGCLARPERLRGDRIRCIEGNLLDPPFPDRSFDVVVAIRMLAHLEAADRFIAGLCRLARHAVLVEYPDARSLNALVPLLSRAKARMEGDTRVFRTYRRRDLMRWFRNRGFGFPRAVPQVFWPMVLHRKLGIPALSRVLEAPPRLLGLTRMLGSPVLLRVVKTFPPLIA